MELVAVSRLVFIARYLCCGSSHLLPRFFVRIRRYSKMYFSVGALPISCKRILLIDIFRNENNRGSVAQISGIDAYRMSYLRFCYNTGWDGLVTRIVVRKSCLAETIGVTVKSWSATLKWSIATLFARCFFAVTETECQCPVN